MPRTTTRLDFKDKIPASSRQDSVAGGRWAGASRNRVGPLVGKVVSVLDGDTTIVVVAGKQQQQIRFVGIDAPESKHTFGSDSKEALSAKILGKAVAVHREKKDGYQRVIGQVYIGARYINREMVAESWAWHYKAFQQRQEYGQGRSQRFMGASKPLSRQVPPAQSPSIFSGHFANGITSDSNTAPTVRLNAAPFRIPGGNFFSRLRAIRT